MIQLTRILQTKTAFIFDMDGTIIDLEELNYSGYKQTVKNFFNLDLDNNNYQKYFSGAKTAKGFQDFLGSNNISDYDVDELITDFRKLKREGLIQRTNEVTKLKSGTKEFLIKLKSQGKKTCLATSTVKEFTNILLSHYQLGTLFDVILTAEDVTKGKPNPQIYNKAVELLNVTKDESIVFEDSRNGILSAKNAGIFCVGIHTQDLNDDYVDLSDAVITDYSNL